MYDLKSKRKIPKDCSEKSKFKQKMQISVHCNKRRVCNKFRLPKKSTSVNVAG